MGKLIVDDEVIEKLYPKLLKASNWIKRAIQNKRPIIIRHHNDCDGYCAAFAIEKAISSFFMKEPEWFELKRIPSPVPYYSYDDCLRDIGNFKSSQRRFPAKSPLFILLDLGSTKQDLESIRKLRHYDCEIIVIDHHMPDEVINEYVDIHINPYFAGGDGSYCTGIIASEVANIIEPKEDYQIYQALSGVSDKTREEILKKYMKGFSREKIEKLSFAIGYEAWYLKGFSSSPTIYDLFNINELVNEINNEAEKKITERIKVMKKYAVKKKNLVFIDLFKTIPRNTFPPSGRSVGLLFKEYKGKVALAGFTDEICIFRASLNNFNVKDIIARLRKKGFSVNGGGHELAGTIKFLPIEKERILKEVESYVNSL